MVEAKNITMQVFLWFLFIVLALFIAFWLYNLYQQYIVADTIGEGTPSSLQCGGYMFSISNAGYENNTLSFVIKNTRGNIIQNLIIQSDYETRTEELVSFSSGREQKIVLENFRVNKNFAVYPEGCARFNTQIISIAE